MEITIRKARPDESHKLTEISFASKRYWNYPEAYFEVWRDELTITEAYINQNQVYVGEAANQVVAYYSIIYVPDDFWAGKTLVVKGYWLEHLFITPELIGRGIGTKLLKHAQNLGHEIGCHKLLIFADPNSKGFYDRVGAIYKKEVPSSINGRTVSLYALPIT